MLNLKEITPIWIKDFCADVYSSIAKTYPQLARVIANFCLREHIFFKGMNIILTYKCNLGCEYCYEKGAKLNYGDIPFDNFEKILKWLRKNKRDRIILLGGEPTLHPNFIDLLKISESNKMRVAILTNLLFNEKIIKAIIDYKGYLILQANINNPYTYKDDSYDLVYANLKRLHNGKRNLVLRYNMYKDNHDFGNIVKIAKETKWPIRFSAVNNPVSCESAAKKNENFREMYPKDKITDFLDTCNREKVAIVFARPVPKCIFKREEIEKYKKNAIKFKCYVGKDGDYTARLIVNPDLSVMGCYGVPIRGPELTSFKDIGELSDYYKGHYIRLRKIPLAPECLSCQDYLNDICQGGCLSEKEDWNS
jgi:MoaA/NifB/PqqE/SkfB family radical SAM enzyme